MQVLLVHRPITSRLNAISAPGLHSVVNLQLLRRRPSFGKATEFSLSQPQTLKNRYLTTQDHFLLQSFDTQITRAGNLHTIPAPISTSNGSFNMMRLILFLG